MRNHGPDTVNVALYVSPCCADIERNRPKKEASFCKKPCLASMDPLSVCVYACTRGSCVDSIWLWVRKETFSKPVFGVSKTSISGFVAVGPHCIYSRFNFINKSWVKPSPQHMQLLTWISTFSTELYVGCLGCRKHHEMKIQVDSKTKPWLNIQRSHSIQVLQYRHPSLYNGRAFKP